MGEIIFTDPVVDGLIVTTEVDGDPGRVEATCLADGCTWETSEYIYVEDDCYTHVNDHHRSEEPELVRTSNPNARTLVEEFGDRHPAVLEALRWLDCGHLPEELRIVAEIIASGVREVLPLVDDGPQLTRALHDLIAAKDALVRQRILRLESEKAGGRPDGKG
jgi:hypothetical protein